MEPEVTTADVYTTMMPEESKHTIIWFSWYLSIPWLKEKISYIVFTLIAARQMAGWFIYTSNINTLGMLAGNPIEIRFIEIQQRYAFRYHAWCFIAWSRYWLNPMLPYVSATFMEPEVTTREKPEEPLDITCPSSCEGLEPGPYQSCASCNQYMMCLDGGIMLDGIFCDGNLEWDDKEKACVEKSSTCPNPPLTTSFYPEEYTTMVPGESEHSLIWFLNVFHIWNSWQFISPCITKDGHVILMCSQLWMQTPYQLDFFEFSN